MKIKGGCFWEKMELNSVEELLDIERSCDAVLVTELCDPFAAGP